ncbi:hypothetical protein [Roseibium sp. M-1]
MFSLFFFGALLYGAVTLVFLIMSSSELLESGLSTPGRLAGVLVTSVFWPVTLLTVSFLVLNQALATRLLPQSGTSPLHFSHRSH